MPVIRSHGIATFPKASPASPTRRGRLGLMAIAAWMRGSVNESPPRACWPLTACVVTAPKEWPDMAARRRSSRPARAWPELSFQRHALQILPLAAWALPHVGRLTASQQTAAVFGLALLALATVAVLHPGPRRAPALAGLNP